MTPIDPPTVTATIEGAERPAPVPPTADPMRHHASRIVAPKVARPRPLDELPTANADASSTRPEQRPANPSEISGRPVVLPSTDFGRKSLVAVMHWEGVVERVDGDEFYARLTPFEGGIPNPGQIEYTDFTLDDLANADDRDLVQEGARFYWTLGKAKNPAGTLTNVSLVRFRRLSSISPLKQKLAEAEADALLEYGIEP